MSSIKHYLLASDFDQTLSFKDSEMLGALLWVTYGVLIGALPVIIANLLVFAAAASTTFRKSNRTKLASLNLASGAEEGPADRCAQGLRWHTMHAHSLHCSSNGSYTQF